VPPRARRSQYLEIAVIITLTLNPAVDQTLWVEDLKLGEVLRPTESQIDPAGKGINVSRMVHRLGWPTIAFGLVAGDTGHLIQNALDAERVQNHLLRIPGQTRINVTVVDRRSGTSTSSYGPGPTGPPGALEQLDEILTFWMQAGRVLVLAGSLPPGIAATTYARYIERARARGLRVILDTDGEPLRLGSAARPTVIKPNIREAEHLLEHSLPTLEAIGAGALALARSGPEAVVISMGGQGAVCAIGPSVYRVLPPAIHRRSTVGSGDSLVAGIAVALARGESVIEGLRLGTAAGAATAMSCGTALGTPAEISSLLGQIQITELDRLRQVDALHNVLAT
jgi:1-phosphofructokinase family hexose kinase